MASPAHDHVTKIHVPPTANRTLKAKPADTRYRLVPNNSDAHLVCAVIDPNIGRQSGELARNP
jgi:hypothetical protein